MTIKNEEALKERANNLDDTGLNGFKLVLVNLYPDENPIEAHLEIYFHNKNEIDNILADTQDPKLIFPISGGHRITGGPGVDQVKVISIDSSTGDNSLVLTVTPIGDYSTYSLGINYQNMDPIFSEIDFKFRPGCFKLCGPDWKTATEPKEDPAIDYLAKDYDSFRHTLISAMMERVPGWQATSEADLDQVLINLFSAAGDELSDYQDRVMNEAYLGTSRKRVSLARHARLMDYHIHQGNQAGTWLSLKAKSEHTITEDLIVWTENDSSGPSSVIFMSRRRKDDDPHQIDPLSIHPLLNEIGLYTWQDSIPALASGCTSAELVLLRKLPEGGYEAITDQGSAVAVQNLIRSGEIKYLLIQEWLNPVTGKESGRDPTKRQLLRLLPEEGAEADFDPVTATMPGDSSTAQWFIRVRWEEKDKLKRNYCFTVDCDDGKVEEVSLFHGNLVEVCHGHPNNIVFQEPGAILIGENEFYYAKPDKWGTICKLPEGPLAYKATLPGGEVLPESTLEVAVEAPVGVKDQWKEVISLIHSDENDDHFIVETDEEGKSIIRFGNGINGKVLPQGAKVHCKYQVGRGLDGNIGADKLTGFDTISCPEIDNCWNPFDIVNGRAPEPVDEIIRRVPEAYRLRQLRAVTLKDYEKRAEELAEVSRSAARYAWTGSWRTVQIAIDPVGTTELTDELREKIASHLNAVRLIGEDLEIRPPRLVPLAICVALCIHSEYWPEDIEYILEQEFSDGFTPGGRKGFFYPDQWTFGQELRASQIIGRAQSVKGVDHVKGVSMKRWNEVTPGAYKPAKDGYRCHATVEPGMNTIIEVGVNEIVQVQNNPDHMEKGFIFFDVKGGRR